MKDDGGIFVLSPEKHPWLVPLARVWFPIKAVWRNFRIQKSVTRWLGPQYRRSRDLLEIDITYACNLHCINCNRSVTQAPEAKHLTLEAVQAAVAEWKSVGKKWKRIRILGGEPTVHPQFEAIVDAIRAYREWHPGVLIEVVSNGYGAMVQGKLAALPKDVVIENSNKTSKVQPHFGPFNMAPVDDPKYAKADYTNACSIVENCGMGLGPQGYFPCGCAGGIDRVTGANGGYKALPKDDDDMLALLEDNCRLCGRFHDGHYVPQNIRPTLTEAKVSPTWEAAYREWRARTKPASAATPSTD